MPSEKSNAYHDSQVAAQIIEDMYQDFAKNRTHVYRANFLRGVFFGLGTFLGGTVMVSLLIIILTWLIDIFPNISDFLRWIINTLSR